MDPAPRVLSIQSHVVHGYAGNRCAVFPLQLLGFDVDCINTVQFSNHTGYPNVRGTKLSCADLKDIYEGLKQNNINKYQAVLTGYIAEPDLVMEIAYLVEHLKKVNPKILFFCDPVMGDNGRFYVPEEMTREFQSLLMPMCDILTPNQFELGAVAMMDVSTEEKVVAAIDKIHFSGIDKVIVTSARFGDDSIISCIGSHKDHPKFKIDIPRLPIDLVGTGDLFTATTCAWLCKEESLEKAVCKVVNTLYAIIKNTLKSADALREKVNDLPEAAIKELRLIENQHYICNPPEELVVQRI